MITVFLMNLAIRARRNKVTTGSQGLIGETGMAQTELSPAGTVFVHGELWRARSRQNVAIGEQVRVTGVNGLQLEVESIAQPTTRTEPVGQSQPANSGPIGGSVQPVGGPGSSRKDFLTLPAAFDCACSPQRTALRSIQSGSSHIAGGILGVQSAQCVRPD